MERTHFPEPQDDRTVIAPFPLLHSLKSLNMFNWRQNCFIEQILEQIPPAQQLHH